MSLELQDWIDYNEGRKDFDKSHFYTLLMNNDDGKGISENDIKKVFSFFPNSENLAARLKSYYSKTDFRKDISNIKEYLIQTTTRDIQASLSLFAGDELEPYLKNKVIFVEDIELVLSAKEKNWQNEQYIDIVEYHIFDNMLMDSPKVDSIFEAYYGLTHNFKLVWYLGAPLINTDINFDHYYDIWKVGGDYAITENGIIVSKY